MDPMRETGVSCNAARRTKHKIMQEMMEREYDKPLAGPAQVDDAYLGGFFEGLQRRGAEGKTPFVAALETTDEWLPFKIMLRAAARLPRVR